MSDILNTFCRPEDVGVSPEWVADYINTLNEKRKVCHSFIMIRHGKVFAEGYWAPFHKDFKHRMFSVSKSFVSGAIGMLVDEGKISLNDKIIDYFPEKLPAEVDPYIAEMKIRDMLMMATCHPHGTTYKTPTGLDTKDWVATFFNPSYKPDHMPGTRFLYDTSSSHTLCALVEKLTGKPLLEYLKEKVLSEIGFSDDAWCIQAPEGTSWGGSGVLCTTRDLARYALLFANHGNINGKQYLSEEYIREATSAQIDNKEHGYGYQIWRQRNNSFAFTGMGGQYALVHPDKDLLLICTSDSQGDPEKYNGIPDLIFDAVIDKITDETIPYDDAAYDSLCSLISGLKVSHPAGEASSPLMAQVNNKTYALGENPMGMQSFTIRFTEKGGVLTYHTDRGDKAYPFGLAEYEDTFLPETHYHNEKICTPSGRPYRCLNAGVWQNENTFLLRTLIIDNHIGNMTAAFTFEDDKVSLNITKNCEWFLNEYLGCAEGKVI
ncbi:MAG: serine hydrolase [Clostridia bacterium]|nr:serine hydrolase [Clostridia bacterium]